MKIKIISLSLVVMAAVVALCFSLDSMENVRYKENDGIKIVDGVVYRLDKNNGSYYVSDFFATDELVRTATQINIVGEIDGVPVKGIKTDYLFYESYGRADVLNLPEGIEYIGEGAFSALDGVKKIELPETVREIGEGAFKNMKGLERVTLPKAVTVISTDMFLSCPRLQTVEVQGEITCVGDYAFAGCKNLVDFDFCEGLAFIGDAAFKGTGLISVYIPSGVVFDGSEGACSFFESCKALKEVEFEDRADESFLLGKRIFSGCGSLEKVVLPEAKEIYIDSYAFSECESLSVLTSTENIYSIGTKAFYGCGLDGIVLSSHVVFENYGTGAEAVSSFEKCSKLRKAIFRGLSEPDYFRLPEKTFKDCNSLKRVILPLTEKETVIGEKAFSGCGRLLGVYNTAKVSYIGESAFYECASLENFTVPENVTVLRSETFFGCTKFKEIYLHGKITRIEKDVFGECEKFLALYYEGTKEDYEKIQKSYDLKKLSDKIIYGSRYNPVLDDVRISVSRTSATLSWGKNKDADGYRIYTIIDDSLKMVDDTDKIRYTFRNLIPGEEYTFLVRAFSFIDGKRVNDPQKECVIFIAGEE